MTPTEKRHWEMVSELAVPPPLIAKRVSDLGKDELNFFHGAIGLASEAGELLDSVKRVIAYGEEVDRIEAVDELGDILFYLVLCCQGLGVTLREVQQANLRKLKSRYPSGKWTYLDATRRDRAAERQAVSEALR